ncbi:hypothetical protein ACJIZ3_013736 [Penstemon smallii]|uniref:CREG-like beta-barrel domain-containing protein n=1 Tax=Penstemon smallii TaxID=265156 RepID=A0ABD3RHY2_9LAMI
MATNIAQNQMSPTLLVLMMIIATAASSPRPDTKGDPAAFARWLVFEASWCVLATVEPNGELFGNIISYTDDDIGIPFFYLTTTLDPTGLNAQIDPRAAFTLSERELGTCATFAKWLVSEASWCVLTTVEPDGELFGNVISYTDVGPGFHVFT